MTAYALLKTVLDTEEFQIKKDPGGKPYVLDREDFFYNLSHSGRYVVIAWGSSEVGVDVQQHDPSVKAEAIAKRYFTLEEQSYIRGNVRRFYEVWTKKESYLKYTGEGLRKNMNSFSTISPVKGIRYAYHCLDGGYSLCLCMAESDDYTLHLLDVQKLQSGNYHWHHGYCLCKGVSDQNGGFQEVKETGIHHG